MDLKGLKFSKMHGIGNDFPIIDESKGKVISEEDKPEACRILCHRNFGVGGDGVLFVEPSDVADIGYRMFNPDGSEAEMCGNGIRCFGDFVYRKGILKQEKMTVETRAGIKTIEITLDDDEPVLFKVDMGLSTFKTPEIPMISDAEDTQTVDIAGNVCESGDLFARDRPMPDVEEGDVLGILNAGAYGFTMSSNYNSRPKASEVLVKDGECFLTRERETFEDLFNKQIIPDYLQ